METSSIAMEPGEALDKLLACGDERHADSQEFNRACMDAYAELAKGRKLIHLSRSIQLAGLHDCGRPRLAIAPADRRQVYFSWAAKNPVALFDSSANAGGWNRNPSRFPRMSRYVQMGQTHAEKIDPKRNDARFNLKDRWGYALVPDIPADVRPEKGQKRDWYILWEVDQWSDSPLIALAPHDPYLLRHVRGELYAVLAEWDLTEVERAILEEINAP